MKKVLVALTIFLTVLAVSPAATPAHAQSGDMEFLLRDTLYGSLIGAFIGGLILLTTDNESDHLDYLVYGGLAGALGGLGYGVYTMSQPMVEVEKDRVTVGLPTIHGKVQGPGHEGGPNYLNAELLRVNF
jgi:hypothetical protein